MNKNSRDVEALIALVNEYVDTENTIKALPTGYISVKNISGHVYNYRQWREGSKIISAYVPEALLNGVKRKIAIRKEQEALLKVVKKDLNKVARKIAKVSSFKDDDLPTLLNEARKGNDITKLVEDLVK